MRFLSTCLFFISILLSPLSSEEFQTTKNIKKDWARLEKLLNDEKNDLADKRKWVFLFNKEYGYNPQKNPYIYQFIQRGYVQFESAFLKEAIKTEKEARDIFIKGDFLFLADGAGGVLIFDISNPIKPQKISEIKEVVYATAIYVDEEYIYIAQGQAGFSVWDVTNVLQPKIVGSQYSNAEGIYAEKPYVYIVGSNNSLKVFDISNPSSIKNIASYNKFNKAIGVSGDGDYIYVADANKKLYKLKFTNNKFSLITSINIEGEARNITVDEKYIYAASIGKGVFIIDRESFKVKTILKEEAVQNLYIANKQILTITRTSGAKIWDLQKISNYRFHSYEEEETEKGTKIEKPVYFQIEGYGEDIAAKTPAIYIANGERGLLVLRPNTNK